MYLTKSFAFAALLFSFSSALPAVRFEKRDEGITDIAIPPTAYAEVDDASPKKRDEGITDIAIPPTAYADVDDASAKKA